jgi:putative addiction module component (TIGR02574 family)
MALSYRLTFKGLCFTSRVEVVAFLQPYNSAMWKGPTELLKDALSLPPEGRAALADSLLESLGQEIAEGAEQTWLDEIQKRLHEIDSGGVAMIPWEETERRLWAKVPSH